MTPQPPPEQPGEDTPPHATTGRTTPHNANRRRHMADLNI